MGFSTTTASAFAIACACRLYVTSTVDSLQFTRVSDSVRKTALQRVRHQHIY